MIVKQYEIWRGKCSVLGASPSPEDEGESIGSIEDQLER
jgi:hypothetical protein